MSASSRFEAPKDFGKPLSDRALQVVAIDSAKIKPSHVGVYDKTLGEIMPMLDTGKQAFEVIVPAGKKPSAVKAGLDSAIARAGLKERLQVLRRGPHVYVVLRKRQCRG